MIVRIMGEGQYRIDDSDRDNLNELDNAAVAAAEGGDETAFLKTFADAASSTCARSARRSTTTSSRGPTS